MGDYPIKSWIRESVVLDRGYPILTWDLTWLGYSPERHLGPVEELWHRGGYTPAPVVEKVKTLPTVILRVRVVKSC